MRSTLYVLLGAIASFYLVLLIVLNRIPHITVKKFGWLSLYNITVRLKTRKIKIRKIAVRFNFHRGKNLPFRFFHLDISGLSIVVNPIAQATSEVSEKEVSPHDVEDKPVHNPFSHLSFSLSKKYFETYYLDRIANQVAIHFYKTSIEDQKKQQKYFIDYVRFENKFVKSHGENKFVVTLINGFLQKDTGNADIDDLVKLFRNIELTITCDTVVSCKKEDMDVLTFELKNFGLYLSLGKLNVPLNDILKPNVVAGETTLESSSYSSTDSDSSVTEEKEPAPHTKKFTSKILLLQSLLDHFNDVEFKMEDFQVLYKDLELDVSNFASSIAIKERFPSKKSDFFNFLVNMISSRISHKSSKVVEIPSLNNSLDIDARRLLAAIDRVSNDPFSCTKAENLDLSIDNRSMITNPTIDLYYDHLEFLNKESKSSKLHKHKDSSAMWLLLHFLSEVTTKLTVLDLDLNIHIPPRGFVDFRRNSKDNNILTFHLSSFAHKSTSRNFAVESVPLRRNGAKLPPSRSIIISQLFKIKHLRMNAVENSIQINKMNLMTCYNVSEENLSVRFYIKKIDVKSVNEAIFHMIREIKNWSNARYNKKYKDLQFQKMEGCNDASSAKEEKPKEDRLVDLEIFEGIPKIISSFKIHITSIEADITCKEGLPSHVFYNEYDQKIDLADFRRGISLKFQNVDFNLKVPKKEIKASIKAIQCFTLSEYDAEYSPEHDMGINEIAQDLDFSDVASFDSNVFKGYTSSGAIKGDINAPEQRAKKVLHIRDIEVCNKNDAQDINKLTLRIPEVDGRVTMFLIWCSLYAILLGKYFSPTVQKVCTKQQMREVSEPNGPTKKKLKLDIIIDSIALVVRLPNSVDMLVEIDTLRISNSLHTKSVRFNTARAYVVHPSTKLWTRLIVIKKSQVILSPGNTCTTIESDGIKLSIPHQFMFYTVIDNVITFFKAIKQIQHNFHNLVSGLVTFDKIYPTEKPAIVFPNVKVRTNAFFLTLDNDPFETELAYIFELGRIVQKERIKWMDAFDKRCEDLRKESLDSRIQLTEENQRTGSPLRNEINGSVSALDPILADDAVEEKIKQATDEFNIALGRGWTQRFRKVRQTKIENKRTKYERCWNEEPISKTMLSKFDILDYPMGTNLLTMYFADLDLEFDKVSPHIQENLDEFIFQKAKGQPKQKYSILVPMFLSLKCKGLFAFLKDYPLPVLSFPKHSQDDGNPTFSLKGNIVINETLFKRPEELRHIFVPFSPILPKDNHDATFYSVYIPRTLTPVKFVVDLECDIDTDRACVLTWCKSYQAAILASMSALDNFTKPQIDDSPLGWWDKMSLLLHGRFNCRVSNELCLHIKGSTDPYDLVGKASGLVFSWKNNVLLRIDGCAGQDQILMVTSDDFLLAIPNYSVRESSSWSIHNEAINMGADSAIDFESAEAKKYQKRIMKLSSDAKVKWKVGLMFERNKDVHETQLSSDMERVSDFKPHYDVEVTGPSYEYHPDSYSGFRLDYLHFALGVELKPTSSTSTNCHNALCLTPLTFHYFFHWWDLMTKHISLPVKQGKLFGSTGKDKSHVKMGPHLFTLKYQLLLEPLTISHFYMHSTSEDLDKNNKVAFTGLKGKFKSCAIDLHQRKEPVRYVNEKLNINNKVYHLKMNKGEVNIEDADIRVVSAIFEEKLIRGYLASQLGAVLSQYLGLIPLEASTLSLLGQYDFYGANLFSNDWVDTDDFVELEQRDLLSADPRILIYPFFSSPAFSYVREFSFTTGGKYPFGNELSHKCVLGQTKPELVQQNIIQERISVLLDKKRNNEKLLEHSVDYRQKAKAMKELRLLDEKLDVVRALKQTLEEETEDFTKKENAKDTSLLNSNGTNGLEPLSRISSGLSLYTSHVSEEDMIHTRILNSDASHYHNRFIIHNMKLQWYSRLRNVFIDYIQRVGDRRSEVYFMSKQAVDLVDSIIKDLKIDDQLDGEDSESSKTGLNNGGEEPVINSCKNSEDIISKFEKIISETNKDEEAQMNFLVKLIHPQIQLIISKNKASSVLVSGRDIELRMLSMNNPGMSDVISESKAVAGLIESRYGVLFNDLHVYVFDKDESKKLGHNHNDMYMGTTLSEDKNHDVGADWPPWIELESFYENTWLQDKLFIERNSIAMIYRKKNPMYSPGEPSVEMDEILGVQLMNKLVDELDLYLSKVVISATPSQYGTVNTVIKDLIIKSKTKRDESLERLKKVMDLTDSSDIEGLDTRVITLQKRIREFTDIFLQLELRGIKLNTIENNQLISLEIELERMKIELVVLMKGLRLRGKNRKNANMLSKIRTIYADQIILHLLKEGREPFLDIALAKLKYTLHQHIDGANFNTLDIKMIQSFNLQKDAAYPELLRPLSDTSEAITDASVPIIKVTWKMLKPVGGIAILEKAKVAIQPLKIEVDYFTITTLMAMLFPKSDNFAKEKEQGAKTDTNGLTIYDEDLDDSDSGSRSSMQASRSETSSPVSSKKSHNPFKRFIQKRVSSSASSSTVFSDSDSPALSIMELQSKYSSDSSSIKSPNEKRSHLSKKSKKSTYTDNDDDVALIIERASTFISVINVEISKADLMVSFKAPKHLNIIDVHKLKFTLPTLKYSHKVWSSEDAVVRLRKDIIKIVLAHTGKILGNKFKNRKRNTIAQPLKQIDDYATFMSVQDLQHDGRSRDSTLAGHKEGHIRPHLPKIRRRLHQNSKEKVIARSSSTNIDQFLVSADVSDDTEEELENGGDEEESVFDEETEKEVSRSKRSSVFFSS